MANVKSFTTERGSIYRYLPDGRVQRFKTVENRLHEPYDVTVFVPDFEWIQRNVSDELKRHYGEDRIEYDQILGYKLYGMGQHVTNEQFKELKSNLEIQQTQGPIAAVSGNGKIDFYVHVEKEPKIGFAPFEVKSVGDNGRPFRVTHLGHKVKSIEYGDVN